jgi:hypothetical protein
MNWAEALFNGMNVASLQNPAGQFVQPTAASLDAALADATTNPDGSITPNYATTDPNAYPMPTVVYAAVSTSPVTADQAAAETTELTQLLQLTGASGSNVSQLPQGWVPLPASLASTAQSDIAKDIVALPAGTRGSGSGGGTSSSGGSSGTPAVGLTGPGASQSATSSTGMVPQSSMPFSSVGGFTPLASLAGNALAPTASTTSSTGSVPRIVLPLLGPSLPGYALVANQGSGLVQSVMIFGLIGLLCGLVLMSTGMLARRRPRLKAAEAGAEPPEGAGAAE